MNVYLFKRGRHVDMVDCGMNHPESIQMIRDALVYLGGSLRKLAITHIHPDHYGAAGVLTGEFGAQLYLHRLETRMIQSRYIEPERLVNTVGRYLQANGVPSGLVGELRDASMLLHSAVTPGLAAVQLDGAETLELGDGAWLVMWTPGHSPGHLCFYDKKGGLLIAGDQLLRHQSPNVGLHPQSTPDPLGDYLRELRRVEMLNPRQVLPGHGDPFEDVSRRIEGLLEHHQKRKRQIEALLDRNEKTGWEITAAVWGSRSNPHESRLALQEGLAHLQNLACERRIVKRANSSVVTWARS